jgi:uncharacterized Zn finger protein
MSTYSNSTPLVNPREQRGQAIAAAGRIQKRNGFWVVPSQSGAGSYAVDIQGETFHCTCPDHEVRQVTCKHICAVQITIKRETAPDGTVTETITKTTTTKPARVTYKQNWPAYNAA